MKSANYGKSSGLGQAQVQAQQLQGQSAAAHDNSAAAQPPLKPLPIDPEVNQFDKDGNTKLHNASYNGNTGKMQKLLDSRANPDLLTRDKYGDSALHKAVAGGRVNAVELLINANATVDLPNKSLQTPGHYAAYHCKKDVIEALLKAKANPMIREEECGDDWLHKVASSDRANNATKLEIFTLFKAYSVTMVENDDHKTPIDYADGNAELIGMLNQVFGEGQTPD